MTKIHNYHQVQANWIIVHQFYIVPYLKSIESMSDADKLLKECSVILSLIEGDIERLGKDLDRFKKNITFLNLSRSLPILSISPSIRDSMTLHSFNSLSASDNTFNAF